ncbi:MAG: hypothetical protein NT154_10675, partial [Verrucomicrobia bacterium]|nr:hypothetical protein [Verrucomicrobiota bacterium]
DGKLGLLGVSEDGLAGTLTPHRPQSLPITFVAPNAGTTVFGLTANPGNGQTVDWPAIGAQLRPAGMDDGDWNAYFLPAASRLGPLWGEFLQSASVIAHAKLQNLNMARAADFGLAVSFLVGLAAEDNLYRAGPLLWFDPQRAVQLKTNQWGQSSDCCVYVVTHGWSPLQDDGQIGSLAINIARHCPQCRVIQVDWRAGAGGLPWNASANIPAVAEEAFRKLTNVLGADFDWNCATFVGHSFGNSVNKGISGLAASKGSSSAGSNGQGKGRAVILDPPAAFGLSDIDFAGFFEGGSVAFSSTSPFDARPCDAEALRVADRHYLIPGDHGKALHCLNDQLTNSSGCNNPWLTGMPGGQEATPGSFSGGVNCEGEVTSGSHTDCNYSEYDIRGDYGGSATANVVRPVDPNDKIGPNGVGPNRVVSIQDEMEYMVRFENSASASAPVQELIVVDYLDAGLDWTTVRFKEIAYGDRIVTPPVGSQSFTVRDTPPTNSTAIIGSAVGQMVVDVHGTVNPQTGRMEWRVTALDTNTSLLPQDALTGFLPPEDGTGRGQGYVKLTVRPKSDLPIGTAITNTATIVFDGNDPINTPAVWNIIGDVPPLAATIAYLPGQIMAGTPFTYTVGLTNTGTSNVLSVILTNALPSGMAVLNTTATLGSVIVTNGALLWDLGTLASGAGATLTITASATQSGTFANNFYYSGGSGLAIYTAPSDLVVAELPRPQLTIRLLSADVELSWPTNASAFHLQSAESLAPAAWADLANTPAVSGDLYRVTIGAPGTTKYFRLVKP